MSILAPTSSSRRLAAGLSLIALLAALTLGASGAEAKGSLSKVEIEFERVIHKVTPTTVVCIPAGVDPKLVRSVSSGVVVSRKGYVLSDGDVGVWYDLKKGQKRPAEKDVRRADDLEIRIADATGKGFKSYKARVIKRDRELDSSLIKMEKPPSGLKYLDAGNSDDLQVGDFAFVMGNSFGLAAEAAPTLTAGLIASLVPQEDATAGGKWRHLYTSAAVNPGVNGGPLVDVYGRLVGTISSAVLWGGKKPDDPELAYAYMGKVVPVERIKACYKELSVYAEVFPEKRKRKPGKSESAALAMVFHHTGHKAYRALVSLEFERKEPLDLRELGQRGPVKIPRYLGPVSGVLVSQDGYVLTSLYNLANITTLASSRRWPPKGEPPAEVKVSHGVAGIEGVTVYLPDGRAADAKLVSYHEGLGLALLQADMTVKSADKTGETVSGGTVTSYELLEPVQTKTCKSGRLLLALGNPFGKQRLDDPLLTAGILGKQHAEDATDPWAGQWQTDAGVTDGNCGGAAVDLHGRLYGILTIWTSTRHGRNSGIGFVIPWSQIEPALGEMKRGRSFRRPLIGIRYALPIQGVESTVLLEVIDGTAAKKVGLKVKDEIVAVDGASVRTPGDVRRAMSGKWADDEVLLRILRDGKELDVKIVLGSRD